MTSEIKILFITLALMPIGIFILLNIINGKRMKESVKAKREEIEKLKVNDKIMTVSGIYGEIKDIQFDVVKLEVAQNVVIEINKASIAACVKS